jgi:cytoskeleton protein RodZ
MPTIGDTLREARMRQRLDIADVEAKTKIRAKYLRALENEEFGMLPGPTFVKTFLRTYSEVLGLDPQLLVEEYRATYESRDDTEHLQPLTPASVARERRRGMGGPPRGPGIAIALAVLAVLAALLVIGLVGEDDGEGGEEQVAQPTETERRQERPQRPERPARPRRVVLRIAPITPTYACIDTGPGTEIRYEGILEAPQTFRGRRLRLNLGKTDVELRANSRVVPIERGPEPVGFVFTPTRQRPLPAGERPCT